MVLYVVRITPPPLNKLCSKKFGRSAIRHFLRNWRLLLLTEKTVYNNLNPVQNVAIICHQVRCMRWGHPSLFRAATSLLNQCKMVCMTNVLHRLIWIIFMSMLSTMYVQSGTHRHFHWRIIPVLTQTPTGLMFVDITGAPKLQRKYVETSAFVVVAEQWPLGGNIRGSCYYLGVDMVFQSVLRFPLLVLVFRQCAAPPPPSQSHFRYDIVIDGGSSSSKLGVYRWQVQEYPEIFLNITVICGFRVGNLNLPFHLLTPKYKSLSTDTSKPHFMARICLYIRWAMDMGIVRIEWFLGYVLEFGNIQANFIDWWLRYLF